MANRKNEHRILIRFKTVQRGIATAAAGNNQLPQIRLRRTADERMPPQNKNGLLDQPDRLLRSSRIAFDREIIQSIQIAEGAIGVDQTRQDFAFGRFAGLPPIRFRR